MVIHIGRFMTFVLLAWLTACATSKPPAALTPRAAKAREFEPESMVELATARVTRQISMFYRLDLLKDNAHSQAMALALRGNEPNVRTCYTSRLDARPELAGDVALAFRLSAATGTVQQIAFTGGSMRDPQVVACMKEQISHVRFNPPHDMQGRLHYQFQVLKTATSVTTTH